MNDRLSHLTCNTLAVPTPQNAQLSQNIQVDIAFNLLAYCHFRIVKRVLTKIYHKRKKQQLKSFKKNFMLYKFISYSFIIFAIGVSLNRDEGINLENKNKNETMQLELIQLRSWLEKKAGKRFRKKKELKHKYSWAMEKRNGNWLTWCWTILVLYSF